MSRISVAADAILNARPEAVYNVIADYRNGHPLIVSKKVFYDFQVEQGGYGAGTILRFKMRVFGVVRELYQRVSEPEPGRVLVEHDIDSPQDIVTTFTVEPVANSQQAHVTISTTMNPTPGLAGLGERLLVPLFNKPLYREELKTLEAVAQQKSLAHV